MVDVFDQVTLAAMAAPIPPSSAMSASIVSSRMSTTPPPSIAEALDSMRQTKLFPLLFSAWFTERVYREDISDYRDRLLVDKDESKVVKAVRSAARKLKRAIAAAEVRDKSAAVESKILIFFAFNFAFNATANKINRFYSSHLQSLAKRASHST